MKRRMKTERRGSDSTSSFYAARGPSLLGYIFSQ
jgi:hypothetical protein